MKNENQLTELYRQRVKESTVKIKHKRKQIHRIGTLKLLMFVAAIASIVFTWDMGWQYVLPVIVGSIIIFVATSKYHSQLFYEKDYWEKQRDINEKEIRLLDYDFRDLENGNEFIDSKHLYTFDLDVFGDNSLFQYINRTCTTMGKRMLAYELQHHLENKEEIEKRQAAVKELTDSIDFRQHFNTIGLLYKGKKADEEEITSWAKSKSSFYRKPLLRLLPYTALLLNAAMLLLAYFEVLSISYFSFVFCSLICVSIAFTRRISKIQSQYGRKLDILSTYAQLIEIVNRQKFTSTNLIKIKNALKVDSINAADIIGQLAKEMHTLDQRNNVLVNLLLNGLCFWELYQMMKIERWKTKYGNEISRWLNAIGEMDAYNSLANFAFNHPEYVYAKISTQPFVCIGKGLGHPLMHRDKCVCNDINMTKREYFNIITGANMAGKSTYLRTIGVNYLLACMGLPVWAKEMEVYPAKLITSLRTSDSLKDSESYFYAELKRLKLIIDLLANGQEMFIILDEILKGTNSIDKQRGSLALIEQFIKLKSNGIIATHDLMLGELKTKFTNNISNYCFEADIILDELEFKYKMREGIAQNMNACFLMKKMGIAIID